jgi:NAD+ kinase
MQSISSIALVVRDGAEEASAQVRAVAAAAGVRVVDGDDARPDLVVVLGGDGTMLRALARYLGTGIPVLGVNYGRVGFLTAVAADDLEAGIKRAFAGEIRTIPLATIDVQVGETRKVAVNDVVVAGSTLGRLIELGYAVGGEELGSQPCDGLIGATPTGSTAYNLSNGGPVLVWGLEAMVLTFIAPHALVIRPLVVPRDTEVRIRNETVDVETTVLIDGHQIGNLATGEEVVIRVGEQHCLLATLPEVTFFRRYAATFGR